MRTSFLTTAIAAALVTSSISLGYAESGGGHGSKGGDASHAGDVGRGDEGEMGHWNNKYDHLITDPMNMTDATGAFFWFEPIVREAKVGAPSPLLTQLDDELAKAADRAETARRKGELTAEEAKQIRDQHDAIRQTALMQIKQHGQIPEDGYEDLQGRILALNEMISRFSHA
jgi:hypothetical protein